MMKSDIETLIAATEKLQAFISESLSRPPAPSGQIASRLNSCRTVAQTYQSQLSKVLAYWIGPYPPVSPTKFWEALTVAKAVRDHLPAMQALARDLDQEWSTKSGRSPTQPPKPTPSLLEQIGSTARRVALALGVLVVVLVVVAVLK